MHTDAPLQKSYLFKGFLMHLEYALKDEKENKRNLLGNGPQNSFLGLKYKIYKNLTGPERTGKGHDKSSSASTQENSHSL